MTDKQKYTNEFESSLDGFVNELKQFISTETGEWTIKGFIDVYKNIYTIFGSVFKNNDRELLDIIRNDGGTKSFLHIMGKVCFDG